MLPLTLTLVTILFMLTKKDEEATTLTKRSYSYNDLIKMQTDSAYSSIGMVIPSQKPSAPRATFGTSQKKKQEKLMVEKELLYPLKGKEGLGPAAYLPSRYTSLGGEEKERPDLDVKLKYDEKPSYSIGKSQRMGQEGPIYNYMHSKNDQLDLRRADLTRRNSSPAIGIGTDPRFVETRADKITPGPTYDPHLKADTPSAPKYTLGGRREIKGKDPLMNNTGTSNLVGPSSYFQKTGKSHSTSSLSRVPYDSKLKREPVFSFTKGPKSLATYRNSVDQTYDIKTKAIMANYDFEYDAGKGLNSGRAWDKKYISQSSQMPLERNKMKSYTIGKSTRERELTKKGNFISMMSHVPASVRIEHPKF